MSLDMGRGDQASFEGVLVDILFIFVLPLSSTSKVISGRVPTHGNFIMLPHWEAILTDPWTDILTMSKPGLVLC